MGQRHVSPRGGAAGCAGATAICLLLSGIILPFIAYSVVLVNCSTYEALVTGWNEMDIVTI